MTSQPYRACYWTSADRQSEIVLTAPEHSGMSDDDLRAEALAEMARAGVEILGGSIVIGEWRP